MTRSLWMTAIGGAMLLLGGLSGLSWGQPSAPCPQSCPANGCVPNVRGFGYFETHWRTWPGEKRPEQSNPRSIGLEPLPTPEGQEQVPLPKATVPHPGAPVPQGEQPLPLPEGTIVSPEGLLLPGGQPGAIPQEPLPGGGTKPSIKNGLPGLPGLPGLEPEPQTVPKAEPKPVPKTEPKVEPKPEPKPAEKVPEKKSSEGRAPSWNERYAPLRRETAATPPAPPANESGVVPLAGGMEPERNAGYDAPWREPAKAPATPNVRDAHVVPVAESMEPERNPGLNGGYRADPIASTAPNLASERVEPAAYATAESAGMAEAGDRVKVPPVALNGYCPVELVLNGRWAEGDLRWTVVHKGLIFRLSGDQQRREFLANPDRFTPVDLGRDRVLLVDQGKSVAGRLEFCAIYEGRLYMFSSEASQSRFNSDPQRYATK